MGAGDDSLVNLVCFEPARGACLTERPSVRRPHSPSVRPPLIRRGPSSSSMTPSISYFKLRLKLGVEEGADGPGPLDLGLCERVRDVVRPVYYDQFLGRTPERIIESPLRFSRSVGVLVAVDN